ncbi:MAG TPA: ThiF family adenylyltransferase [Syntrophorhabdaceae bacterium]|nr:ThiF family adenylyltransferase [Syntrophorhabdaceae bacterium]
MKDAERYAERLGDVTAAMEISVDRAKDLLRDDQRTVIIDIRSNGQTSLGYIKGARFVPLGLIQGELNKLAADKSVPVIVYCAFGDRSVSAAEMLRKMGFINACSLSGGFNAWLSRGGEIVTDSLFTISQLNRYSRNILLDEIGEQGQRKLMSARVLLVGAGGLASSAGLYLAACGIGTIGLVDYDWVELSNLNRQIMHGTEDVGRLKVESGTSAIKRINPDVNVVSFPNRLTPMNALEIIEDFDMVMDASDNAGTKFLLNDACFFAGKPYVFGGAVGFSGQAGLFWPKQKGPCLRCLFPEMPSRALVPTCSEAGVLGVVPGQIGLVQATEIIKLILGIGEPMIGKYYIYNALSLTARFIVTGRSVDCPLCGTNPRITSLSGEGSVSYENEECA